MFWSLLTVEVDLYSVHEIDMKFLEFWATLVPWTSGMTGLSPAQQSMWKLKK